jgi:PTS system glucose-specific IIA component
VPLILGSPPLAQTPPLKLCGSLDENARTRDRLAGTLVLLVRPDEGVTTVSKTRVLAPVAGRAVPLRDVPDPVFSQGMVGYGAAIDPPRGVVEAVAPVSGKLLKLMPHAYIVMTADNVGVLVHLGLDTVALNGEGFTTHVSQGDDVSAGQVMISYDVPAIEAKGLNPIVAVVVMDERESENVVPSEAVNTGADVESGADLFTANK